MRRREFITLIGGGFVACVSPAQAQQPTIPAIGYLYLGSQRSIQQFIEAFRSGLAALGYTEGKNIRVLYRFADGNADRLSSLTHELVSLGAMVIVTAASTSIQAAHVAAPNVPIVSWAAADPVGMGWAQTMARPGGMITGVFLVDTNTKRFELLKEVRPQATKFGLLLNASNPSNPPVRSITGNAARALGFKLETVEVKDQSEFPEVFDRMVSLGVEGLAISPDPVLGANNAVITKLSREHKLPSVGDEGFADAGGLLAHSTNYAAMARRSAWYVDQILKGIPPRDLPAEEAREFKVIVNLKTAKELGITIPPPVLARADEVIE
jgi:putative ABC transport system substrate-binding protein